MSTPEGRKRETQELGKDASWEKDGGAMHRHAPTQPEKLQRLVVYVVNILITRLSKNFVVLICFNM